MQMQLSNKHFVQLLHIFSAGNNHRDQVHVMEISVLGLDRNLDKTRQTMMNQIINKETDVELIDNENARCL